MWWASKGPFCRRGIHTPRASEEMTWDAVSRTAKVLRGTHSRLWLLRCVESECAPSNLYR